MQTKSKKDPEFDVIITGAGPAGLTAALYAARAGMKILLLEGIQVGGQVLLTEIVENYPGFPKGIKAQELAAGFKSQALNAGAEIIMEQVQKIVPVDSSDGLKSHRVKTENREYSTYCVILALGAGPKRLGVPGEDTFTGRGVSYCATCDGPLFREREIVVVGGGNAACEEALFLSKFARKVTIIHRRDKLRADKIIQDRLKANPKIAFAWSSSLVEVQGKDQVQAVAIEDVNTKEQKVISCAGVFIFAGLKPNTDFVKGIIALNNLGFIVTDHNLQTSCKGIFACGDCRAGALHQIVAACSEGAQATVACRNYLQGIKGLAYGY